MSENKFNSLYSNLEKIEVTGIIVSNSKETNYKKSYEIKVLSINGDTKYKNTKLLMYIDKSLNLEYGKKVKLTGDYRKATDSTNYKAFSYKNYLKTKNIYGTLTADKNIEVSKENYLNPLFIISNNLKNKIETNLDNILGKNSEIVKGILLRRY